jgi:hypothetical protein
MDTVDKGIAVGVGDLKGGTTQLEAIDIQLQDAACHRRLRHKMDRRLLPICAWVYLLNYLDRSNIGNAKILNSETHDSFLQSLGMSSAQYSITITLFSIAYAGFDVPANWILQRFFRSSIWFSLLFFCWGILTLSFAFLKNFASVVVIRFLIGTFEAGFYPGMVDDPTFCSNTGPRFNVASRACLLCLLLVPARGALTQNRHYRRKHDPVRCFWRLYRLRHRPHQPSSRSSRLVMVVHYRRGSHNRFSGLHPLPVA